MAVTNNFDIYACAVIYVNADGEEYLTQGVGLSKAEAVGSAMKNVGEKCTIKSKTTARGEIRLKQKSLFDDIFGE